MYKTQKRDKIDQMEVGQPDRCRDYKPAWKYYIDENGIVKLEYCEKTHRCSWWEQCQYCGHPHNNEILCSGILKIVIPDALRSRMEGENRKKVVELGEK